MTKLDWGKARDRDRTRATPARRPIVRKQRLLLSEAERRAHRHEEERLERESYWAELERAGQPAQGRRGAPEGK